MLIRPARRDEAGLVSDLAMRSKAYWGYDDDRAGPCGALPGHGRGGSENAGAPEHIRTGVGRSLFEHAVTSARAAGLTEFAIDADPFAEDFYLLMGAIRTGATPSPILAGRVLPRLTFQVASG